ncbi:MAG: hypothetical protein ABMB14_31010, partial [Myxococcota bacterium]
AIAMLRADPPPGEVLNLGWVAGNPLIHGLYPVRRVFVDPRWEAYPRPFLLAAIAAVHDPALFAAELDQWRPGFVVVELRERDAVQRAGELVAAGWAVVHVDTDLAVLVPTTDATAAYRARHPPLGSIGLGPVDGWSTAPVVRAQQQARFARLRAALGDPAGAAALVAEARATSDDPAVAAELAD